MIGSKKKYTIIDRERHGIQPSSTISTAFIKIRSSRWELQRIKDNH